MELAAQLANLSIEVLRFKITLMASALGLISSSLNNSQGFLETGKCWCLGFFHPSPKDINLFIYILKKSCGFSTALFLTFRSHNLGLEVVKVESTPWALSESVCWLFIPRIFFLPYSVLSFSSIHRRSKFHSNPAASLAFCLASCMDYFPGERGSPVRLWVKKHSRQCNLKSGEGTRWR